MKIVYKLINDNIRSTLVNDDYQLQESETFEKPVDSIYQPFSFVNGVIVGSTQEQWQAFIKGNQAQPEPQAPTQTDITLAALSQTILNQAALITQQDEAIKQLQSKESGSTNV